MVEGGGSKDRRQMGEEPTAGGTVEFESSEKVTSKKDVDTFEANMHLYDLLLYCNLQQCFPREKKRQILRACG